MDTLFSSGKIAILWIAFVFFSCGLFRLHIFRKEKCPRISQILWGLGIVLIEIIILKSIKFMIIPSAEASNGTNLIFLMMGCSGVCIGVSKIIEERAELQKVKRAKGLGKVQVKETMVVLIGVYLIFASILI